MSIVTADFQECFIFLTFNDRELKHVGDQGPRHICGSWVRLDHWSESTAKTLLEKSETSARCKHDRLLNRSVHFLKTTNPTFTHPQTHIHKPDK